jgi:hypothetical protein
LPTKIVEVIWCLIIIIGARGGPVVVVCSGSAVGGVRAEKTAAAEAFSEEGSEGGDVADEETDARLKAGPDCEAGGNG